LYRAKIERKDFIAEGTQGELFPTRRPRMVIFIHFPDVTEQEFREIVEFAEPSYVFELRASPRFDIGGLDRRSAFQAFKKKRITYLDLTSTSMGNADPDALVNNFSQFLRASRPAFEKPIVFLTSQPEEARGVPQRVLEACLQFGMKPDSVYEVPRFVTSASELSQGPSRAQA
jgi:hypothetical protein